MGIAEEFEKFKTATSNVFTSIADEFEKFRSGAKQQDSQPAAPIEQTVTKPDYFERLKFAESGGDPSAKSKTSSAAGYFQFIEKTWKEQVNRHGFDYSLEDRFNPEKSLNVVKKLTEENKVKLQNKLGYEPTDSQLYAAHFFGVTGALNFYKALPNKLAKDVVSKDQVNANKNIFYDSKTKKPRTVAQVHELLQRKIGE